MHTSNVGRVHQRRQLCCASHVVSMSTGSSHQSVLLWTTPCLKATALARLQRMAFSCPTDVFFKQSYVGRVWTHFQPRTIGVYRDDKSQCQEGERERGSNDCQKRVPHCLVWGRYLHHILPSSSLPLQSNCHGCDSCELTMLPEWSGICSYADPMYL